MTLHPHDLLINIIISLTSEISSIGSPMGKNGFLKSELNYISEYKIFEDNQHIIFGEEFHPPDGFIRNLNKNISITVECKSAFDMKNTNLNQQLLFYSDNELYREIFLSETNIHEILIFICPNILKRIEDTITDLDFGTNMIIWTAEETDNDMYFIQKRFGNHIDNDLDEKMTHGVIALPPPNLLLLSPNISSSGLISEIAKRLASNLFLFEINLDTFISNQKDSIIPYQRIRNSIRKVFRLIPELGELSNNKIIFKKRINVQKIYEKINFINILNKGELQKFLKKGIITDEDIETIDDIRKGYKTLDEWVKK